MHAYTVFDLDGTVAPIGKKASEKTARLMRRLEKEGRTVILCSGKPTYYLVGFCRQLGLKDPILIGETGAAICFGISLPPQRRYDYPFPAEKRAAIAELKKRIDKAAGEEIWYQPNEIALTPFFKTEDCKKKIAEVIAQSDELLCGIHVYPQCDCFDVLPEEISKKNGIEFLAQILGAKLEQILALGDGINDVPMLEYADFSIGIGRKEWDVCDLCFEKIEEALTYILENNI